MEARVQFCEAMEQRGELLRVNAGVRLLRRFGTAEVILPDTAPVDLDFALVGAGGLELLFQIGLTAGHDAVRLGARDIAQFQQMAQISLANDRAAGNLFV